MIVMKDYRIDEKGIYYSENSYHNDVDIHYVVEFSRSDAKKQLHDLLYKMRDLGAQERTQQIATLLGVKQ